MRIKTSSCDPLDDGWNEPAVDLSRLLTDRRPVSILDDGWNDPTEDVSRSLTDRRPVSMSAGDTVLYRAEGKVTPAVLVELAGKDCWLARDARYAQGLIYLGAENITARLPRMDLLEDAA